MLEADVAVRLGGLDLDVSVEVDDGEVVAVVGPNGAGKTTLLRAVAGLVPIDAGRIALDGAVLDDPAAGVLVPPADRPVGLVFQDHLLFPRLTALDNVAFGLRARGMRRAPARARAAQALARVGLADRAGARPAALSGGQAQRVALARTLATEPAVLLLDEPLAALDPRTRSRTRAELRRHLDGFPGARLLVTHDPVDALVLADRLVVLEAGRVTQSGSTADVARRPRSPYAAHLVGVNLLPGSAAAAHTVRVDGGIDLVVAEPVPAARVAVAVRPRAVALHRSCPEGSARNVWAARVLAVEAAAPDRVRVEVTAGASAAVVAEVTPAAVADLGVAEGIELWASVKAVDVDVYEA
ncbi:MAG TPA: ABC transporter ATP-binding protein [Acidimicrobiales bacterium]|nr:ABC transporter ATP-binding protein [Acidimicrobiales bacterium]